MIQVADTQRRSGRQHERRLGRSLFCGGGAGHVGERHATAAAATLAASRLHGLLVWSRRRTCLCATTGAAAHFAATAAAFAFAAAAGRDHIVQRHIELVH